MEDVFDRWAWLYAFCRERLFSDHTELVARVMEERFKDQPHPVFVELGCGPGFYSIAMAQRFSHWRVIGIDRSDRLLQRATDKVVAKSLANCSFCRGDATCASAFPVPADFVVASRLLFILSDRRSALQAMYSGLRPGGTLLIAEPLPGWRSRIALYAMKLLRSIGPRHFQHACAHPETQALDQHELVQLIASLEWTHTESWSDRRYHYFLCRKPMASDQPACECSTLSSSAPSAHLPDPARTARESLVTSQVPDPAL